MAKFFLTNKAVEDLSDIWLYTLENWSEKQADIYYQLLIASFEEISFNPNIGKNYFDILDCLQGLKVGMHIVFYRQVKKNIEIIRILHEQMDLKNRIKD
ncbi:MAG: plasmid stabilization protein [Bacteroidetes bacterium RIFOXYA12_FULL_35_11]|nr:MAG: plasmid stabilization protein [Bacteroidetes bacterium GWF2_35_48]OFY82900.1 MAG: plasmid stabilization protein [Bacteroidetes bacterium RIFOXYA12_FULL_35_11]OFZ01854.1 MAG: plasmid stabilization protein [Bacteroidetes bacterium RIFOXYC12_FULL_35_7]HBX52789.1 type II toxin-antitoxin system RelE/ParE family toxin [Bacteroidales bacterium]